MPTPIGVFAISPPGGSPLGGEWVVITGVPGGPGTTVTFGGVPAASLDTSAAGIVRALTPPGGGTVPVVITSPASPPQTTDFAYSELTLSVIRPDDLLVLRFELVNLRLDGPDLVRSDPAADAFVIVGFPPQHIAEVGATSTTPLHPPVHAAMAAGSSLAFRVPPATARLPLTLAALLDWDALTLVPAAGTAGSPVGPADHVTALELPYRIYLTVDRVGDWRLTPPPTSAATLTQLWQATLRDPALRVTWARELSPLATPLQKWGTAAGSLPDGDQRRLIGQAAPALTSGDLSLSALGASVDLQAALAPSAGLTSWRQVIDLGRDSNLRLVTPGYLAPWGHQAVLVDVVDREPLTADDGTLAAGLMSRATLVVTQPVVTYADPSSAGAPHLELPFTDVRITTLSVAADAPAAGPPPPLLVAYNGQHVPFHLVATDHGGAEVHLTMPLVFVPGPPPAAAPAAAPALSPLTAVPAAGLVSVTGPVPQAVADQLSLIPPVDLAGQLVHFIPPPVAAAGAQAAAGVANAARLATSAMTFAASAIAGGVTLPRLAQAMVAVPGAEAVGAAASYAISYYDKYLNNQLPAGVGQVFADVAGAPTLAMAASAAGGLATPALAMHHLSQELGPVGDISALVSGADAVNPADILGSVGAKLLGGLDLNDLLQALPLDGLLDKLPKLVRTPLPQGATRVSFDWSPPLKSWPASAAAARQQDPPFEVDLDSAKLTLHSESTVYTDGTPPKALVSGKLTSPGLSFFQSLDLTLDELAFTAEAGRKTDLTIGTLTISLRGKLAFLRPLVQALPADGFSDPPFVTTTPDGITAGYTAALPAIGVGALSIENLAFSAALTLPFAGNLGLRLGFASREHPFLVTVAFIGGGGYFVIDVAADGSDGTGAASIRQIEGSLELAAQLDVDLLIVTANVHVMAGFYFMVSPAQTSFSGFVRIGGSVDLLGLISVSVELYLALAYNSTQDEPTAIVGSASLTLSVHVLLMTKSLTLSVQKSFAVPAGGPQAHALGPAAERGLAAGEPGPPATDSPTLDDWMTIDEWRAYRQAFAEETA